MRTTPIALIALTLGLTGCLESAPTNYSCDSGAFGVTSLSIVKKKSATLGTQEYEFCKREGNVETYSIKHPDYNCAKTDYQMRLVFDPITGILYDTAKTPTAGPNTVTLKCAKVN